MKRAVDPEEPQRDAVHAIEEEADGDRRRKKTRRASSHAVAAGANGNRKFACPYFKRNPKKYRKWTSCPGPGWDEVHRVKYAS
jgi:ribosome modulation factor